MGKIRDFLTQDAGTAIDRMNEPWLRFAHNHKAIYLLIIAAAYGGAWFYGGWPMVLTIVGFTVAVGVLGYAWAWAHRAR
jgi:hypothetical protein